jgi:predicted transposase/invertase (TIGR01784 family)
MAKKYKEQIPAPTVYLNPLTDFGFKKVFGDKELLIDFLNGVLPEAHITDVKYQPTEHLGDWATERKAVYDLLCTNEQGEYFLVEMQRVLQKHFADRALFYSSFLIRNQAPKAKTWNYELKAVYVVSILNFSLDDMEDGEVIERVALMNERTKKRFSQKLQFAYIQLQKFTKKIEELQTNTDYWLFLLKNLDNFQSRPPEVQGRIFERLFNIARCDKLKPKEMKSYNKSILEYSDIAEAIEYAAERAEARTEAKTEKKERIRVVGRCLQKGMSIVEIADLTDLPIEAVKEMIKEIQE